EPGTTLGPTATSTSSATTAAERRLRFFSALTPVPDQLGVGPFLARKQGGRDRLGPGRIVEPELQIVARRVGHRASLPSIADAAGPGPFFFTALAKPRSLSRKASSM